MKGKKYEILENQHTKYMKGCKDKKIRKKKTGPDKKQNFHLRTQTSILFDLEIQETIPYTAAIRQYKQQLNFVKNCMSQVVECYNFCPDSIPQQIDSLGKQLNFPSISIDRLFDHKETKIFSGGYISNDLTDYLKIVNNQLQHKRKKIILEIHNDSFLITADFNRRQDTEEYKGQFITLLEKQVFDNRQNFMEKIQLNQTKYKNSNSQLSQISQELLFLSKTYMENTSRIKKLGNQLALKMLTNFSQPQIETQKLYYEVIMKKNIAYAVKQHEIDFLNYFRRKEHEQKNFYDFQSEIKDESQLSAYLKNKKPKKGKLAKYGLQTACSCCFSGYFQAYNPLIPCQNCHLRCHKLCYYLQEKTCGNCSYQRLLKSAKQTIPYCIICKQKGEMIIKLKDKVYVHGFCLIMHNQWKIEAQKVLNQHKKLLQKECQPYYNKNSIFSFTSNQTLKSQQKKFELLFQEICIDISSSQTLEEEPKCGSGNHCSQMEYEKSQVEYQKKHEESQTCKICSERFHQNFYGSCVQCNGKSHIFCTFFQGFEFKELGECGEKKESNNRINILFDCCSKSIQRKEKLKKSREFVLNRNRFLFDNL